VHLDDLPAHDFVYLRHFLLFVLLDALLQQTPGGRGRVLGARKICAQNLDSGDSPRPCPTLQTVLHEPLPSHRLVPLRQTPALFRQSLEDDPVRHVEGLRYRQRRLEETGARQEHHQLVRTCNDSLRPRNRKIRYSLVMSKLLTGLNRISFSLAAEKVSSLERPSKLMMFTCFRRTISSGSWKRSHDSGEFAAVKSHESQRSHIRVYVAIMTRDTFTVTHSLDKNYFRSDCNTYVIRTGKRGQNHDFILDLIHRHHYVGVLGFAQRQRRFRRQKALDLLFQRVGVAELVESEGLFVHDGRGCKAQNTKGTTEVSRSTGTQERGAPLDLVGEQKVVVDVVGGVRRSRSREHDVAEQLFHAAVRETHQHVELLLVEQLLHQVSEVVFFPVRVRIGVERVVGHLVVFQGQVVFELDRVESGLETMQTNSTRNRNGIVSLTARGSSAVVTLRAVLAKLMAQSRALCSSNK
jgi:hypothetical protein